MRCARMIVGLALVGMTAALVRVSAGSPDVDTDLLFERDVRPILARKCFGCHGGEHPKSALNLDSTVNRLAGGASGEAAVVPGEPDLSRLLLVLDGRDRETSMPPQGEPLGGDEIALIRRWITEGARVHDPSKGHWHWAYRAPALHDPRTTTDTRWPRNAVDQFVLAQLERESMPPSPEADRATLLRRASLDLIGLPPTLEELDAFIADESPDAYERVVDRLLASPHYGEHWARMWLDLARYADTHGYEKDGRRSMWPWRDWVIDAFNRDLPWDRFALEQIAGDLLDGASLRTLVATGFCRNTMINEEGGVDPEEFRTEAVIDRVNTFGTLFLGATVACAQCHDHKFDPIPQRDYYALYAFFNQDLPDVVAVGLHESRAAGAVAEVPAASEWERFEALIARRDAARRAADVEAAAAVDAEIKPLVVGTTLVMGVNPSGRETHIFQRGSFLSPGAAVEPAPPSVLPPMDASLPRTRLGLAQWLAAPENPLFARVAVNRLWERMFGRGLVATSEDLGTQGEAPTHAELLDWLAGEFTRGGFSQKALLRTLALSATYRQSSHVRSEALERDPENRLLGRASRVRLEGEVLRDIALRASGLLVSTIGGPSVFPPQPPGVWTMIYSNDQWVDSVGDDRHRRGLYTFWRRTAPYPTFGAFDAPSRELTCVRRPRTNTPLQALVTLNDPQFVEAAAALAGRVHADASSPSERITLAFRRATSRRPEPAELDRLVALFDAQLESFTRAPDQAKALLEYSRATVAPLDDPADLADFAALQIVCSVILNLDETLSRN